MTSSRRYNPMLRSCLWPPGVSLGLATTFVVRYERVAFILFVLLCDVVIRTAVCVPPENGVSVPAHLLSVSPIRSD